MTDEIRIGKNTFITLTKIKCDCCGRIIEPEERFAKFFNFKFFVPHCKDCLKRDGIDLDKIPYIKPEEETGLEDEPVESESEWETFLSKWYSIFRDTPVTVAQIQHYLKMDDDSYSDGKIRLIDILPDSISVAWKEEQSFDELCQNPINARILKKRSFVRVLGKALSKRSGQIMSNGLIIRKKGIKHQAVAWRVMVSRKPEGEGP